MAFPWCFFSLLPNHHMEKHHDHAMTGARQAEQSHSAGGNDSRELHAFLGLHPVQFLAFLRERFGAQAARLPLKKTWGTLRILTLW